jgi:hypothetical protein
MRLWMVAGEIESVRLFKPKNNEYKAFSIIQEMDELWVSMRCYVTGSVTISPECFWQRTPFG